MQRSEFNSIIQKCVVTYFPIPLQLVVQQLSAQVEKLQSEQDREKLKREVVSLQDE